MSGARGQATIESALLTAVFVLGVLFGLGAPLIPLSDDPTHRRSLLSLLLEAWSLWSDSWAFLLHLPYP